MKKTISYVLLFTIATVSLGFSVSKNTKGEARFFVVCTANFHNGERTPLFCVGTVDNYDEAKQKAANHNRSYGNGHDAAPCAGSCPGCN